MLLVAMFCFETTTNLYLQHAIFLVINRRTAEDTFTVSQTRVGRAVNK
jgi:hypothetical protein